MKLNGTRRLLAGLLALIMVLVLLPTVSAQADGEIEIANYEQLKAFAARVNGGEHGLSAKLTEDITCTDKTWTPIGDAIAYQGTFNGQGHTITGLSNADVDYSGLADGDKVYIGLFGVVESGKVQNVVIEDCELSFASDADVNAYMGAVVGRNESGTVEDCSVSGTVSGSKNGPNRLYVGGVVGQNRNSVRNCRNTGAVSASGNASVYGGGIVGDSSGSEQYCVNTGAVTGAVTGGGNAVVGGVTGSGESVKNCLNAGAVSGGTYSGGIVGFTVYGTVENCLNVGAVSDGCAYSGGIVGQNAYGAVKTCLSVGAVSGTVFVGGVVGHCPNAASPNFCVENCYCLYTETSDAIGDEGAATVTNVAALTAEQLKSLSNCVGFSTDTWYEGLSYPVLKNLSGEVHLYANSNEDLVLQRFICAYAPTKIANPFTYEGHEFTGWNTQADGEGDPYSEDDEITLLPGETLSLSAQWKTNAFMIMFQNEDGTELQKGLVNAGETPVYEGETPEKEATVEHLYTFAGWKLLGTETVLTELPAVDGEATYVAAYTESDRVYTGPVWAWDGYESATATFTATDDTTFTQVLTAEGDAITHMTTVEPDCEYPGVETYTAKVTFLGKDYFNDKTKEIAKRDHIWVFDEFVWTPNEQGIYTVVANFHCERYASHTLEFIPVAGMATDPETCTEDGCVHYVAFIGAEESPDGQYHEDKLDIVIPAHGHQWSAPDYERIETETGYDVYAIVRCYYDYSHRIEETVHATYEVITPPTLYEEGLGRYTADFEDEHLWDIQWEVVIPKLALGLYGEDVDALDVVEHTGDGETLYRYDVKLRNDAEVLPIASMQMFIAYDEALTLVETETDLPGAVILDEDGVLAFTWATDGEGVRMENGAVVATLYFRLSGNVENGEALELRFVEKNGFVNTVSYLENNTPVEATAFETVDGSIVFKLPDAITIAGEDVFSGDVYVIEDGKILYRYDIRAKDLPEAGLWINSAQIFAEFDHAVMAVAKTEGKLDWTISENGDKLMAVWASDAEVQLKEDDVLLTLWLEKTGPVTGKVDVTFTTNLMGDPSAASITFCGAVTEIETNTIDGSITFEEVLLGDANCDGQVTAADAALVLRAIVGLSELSPRGVLNADADGDLEVTAADAAAILRYVVGLIDAFPAEEP